MLTMGVLGTLFDIFTGQALWKGIWAIIDALFLVIDSMVYAVINYTYSIFTLLAGARVLDANTLTDMANRVYIFIGVVALFLVAYALLTAIIDPDKASKGDNSLGKVIPNVALAIVGIAIVPTVFTYAYRVQKAILCENIIPKWLIEENYENIDSTNENAGATLATELFQSFFIPKDSNMDGYQAAVNSAREGDSFISAFGPLLGDVVDGNITYLIIISTVAGLFCAYVLLGYCLDAGLRAVKLAYLQLLAPLPILLTIIPGQKKVFKNWLSKTVSCFLEVFVRIFAMAFVIYIINHLPNLLENNQLFEGACATQPGIITVLLIKAIIICALFDFMKQAPKLISEITGIDSKGFGIGLKGKGILGDAFGTLGGIATGAATGALGAGWSSAMNTKGGLKNKVAGFGAGLKYGAAAGAKGGGNQFNKMRTQHYKDIVHGKGKAGVFGGQGYIDKLADDNRKSTENSYNDYIKSRIDDFKNSKLFKDDVAKRESEEIAMKAKKLTEAQIDVKHANTRYEFEEAAKNSKQQDYEASLNDAAKFLAKDVNAGKYNEQDGAERYAKDVESYARGIFRNKLKNELEVRERTGNISDSEKDYLNSLRECKAKNVEEAMKNLRTATDEYATPIDHNKLVSEAEEYFQGLNTSKLIGDKATIDSISQYQSDVEFTNARDEEKELKKYKKTKEFAQQAAVYEEALKSLNEPGTGKGTAKAPGDSKAGGSK